MSEQQPKSDDRDPVRIFRVLSEGPGPGHDSAGSWRRLLARIRTGERGEVRGAGWMSWQPARLGLMAAATIAIAFLLLTLFNGDATVPDAMPDLVVDAADAPEPVAAAEGPEPLLLIAEAAPEDELAPAISAPDAERPTGHALQLRLVRAGVGESTPPALGAGGSDPLRDIRPTLEAALPEGGFALAGAWTGEVSEGAASAAIEGLPELHFQVATAGPGGTLRLTDVTLGGPNGQHVADELVLEPGRVYVIGLPGDGGRTLLAIRLRSPAAAPGATEPRR